MYTIKYWKNNNYREMGISDIYTKGDNLDELKFLSNKLVDRDGFACVEIVDNDEEVLYFYEGDK